MSNALKETTYSNSNFYFFFIFGGAFLFFIVLYSTLPPSDSTFKKTSDGTAQTDPFQKILLENPKDFFKSLKVPTGVKKPIQAKNTEGTASSEPNAIPSKTYTAIIKNKKNSEKAGTIGGIASGQGPTECGSFFNPGDNRVLRSVYKEDVTNVSVSSMSFNPVSWTCTACPRSHSVFDTLSGGG
jgi:hypothetical protein